MLRAAAAVAAAACLVTLGPATGRYDAVVYSAVERGGTGESHLWVLPLAGDGRPRRLTSGQVRDENPAVSPNGQQIAFNRSYAGTHSGGLYLLSLRDGRERRVSFTEGIVDLWPFWSPDGRRIGLTRCPYVSLTNAPCSAWIVELDPPGAAPTRLPGADWESHGGSWNPVNGADVLLARKVDGLNPYEIWRVSIADRTASPVVPHGCCGAYRPTYAPDGKRFSYVSFVHSEFGDVYLANADGSQPTRVTCTSGWQTHRWSPDGRELMIYHATGEAGLWRIPVPSSGGSCVHPTVRVSALAVNAFSWARLTR